MANCFIIRRRRGNALYLTPFNDVQTSASWSEDEPVKWFASTGLTTGEKDDALFLLYGQIDRGVDRWIQDKRYIPRLLISAAVFLVLYFFFSLAVRDPIPVIDEFLISLAGAIGIATLLTKKDKKSDLAMKKRLLLKQNGSRGTYEVLEELTIYEEYLNKCSSIETLELADRLCSKDDLPQLELSKVDFATEFKNLLLKEIELNDRALYKEYLHLIVGKIDNSYSARLVKLAMQKQLDLPLLALMLVISK